MFRNNVSGGSSAADAKTLGQVIRDLEKIFHPSHYIVVQVLESARRREGFRKLYSIKFRARRRAAPKFRYVRTEE